MLGGPLGGPEVDDRSPKGTRRQTCLVFALWANLDVSLIIRLD